MYNRIQKQEKNCFFYVSFSQEKHTHITKIYICMLIKMLYLCENYKYNEGEDKLFVGYKIYLKLLIQGD